ncbi:AraC family transcriptional regulator ligand-binding domain-containing protein, partial [Diaphorobacter sp.]|uniref:AraC family transcriptional regulator ligand-binding domain-containing protein n=1 Tax=Diaphorobacter sp. TaxID=1934310 RepID=UPI003D0D16E9
MAFVQAIVRAYAARGMSPAPVLAQAQITPEQAADAGARITAHQMEVLSAGAMRELDDEALGWFSRRLPWGSYGMLARASLSAPTLGLALARWCRH